MELLIVFWLLIAIAAWASWMLVRMGAAIVRAVEIEP